VDRNNVATDYGYDAASRLTRVATPDDVTTYGYDGFGRLTVASDGDALDTFSYDVIGQLVSQRSGGQGSVDPDVTLRYAYDASGLPTSVQGPTGTVDYRYDASGRLAQLVSSWAGTYGLTYDDRDRLTRLSRPSGLDDVLAWNDANQLLSRVASKSGAALIRTDYAYELSGRRASMTDAAGAHAYAYDAIGQIVAADHPGLLPDESFTYDAAGNRASWAGSPAASVAYDANGRLLRDNRFDYAYDGEGRRVRRTERSTGAVTTYDWTARGLLGAVHLPDGNTTTYRYDPLGRRIEASDGQSVTRFAWDRENVALEFDGANRVTSSFLTAPVTGQPFAVDRGGVVEDYLLDGLGSTVAMADRSGLIVEGVGYSVFGTPTASGDDLAYGFTGHQWDSTTALTYARGRYYDSALGAFLSEDPLPAVNYYAYASNDPTDLSDASGCQATTEYGLLQKARETIRQAVIQEIEGAVCEELIKLAVLGLGGGPNGLGAAAENFVADALGTAHNNTTIMAPSGNNRIPDFIVEDRFVEVKNTVRLSGTSQIRDFVAIAERDGKGPLVLVTRASTKLSGPLQDLIRLGKIQLLNCLPG
jgi:RHS repeat-associated protein